MGKLSGKPVTPLYIKSSMLAIYLNFTSTFHVGQKCQFNTLQRNLQKHIAFASWVHWQYLPLSLVMDIASTKYLNRNYTLDTQVYFKIRATITSTYYSWRNVFFETIKFRRRFRQMCTFHARVSIARLGVTYVSVTSVIVAGINAVRLTVSAVVTVGPEVSDDRLFVDDWRDATADGSADVTHFVKRRSDVVNVIVVDVVQSLRRQSRAVDRIVTRKRTRRLLKWPSSLRPRNDYKIYLRKIFKTRARSWNISSQSELSKLGYFLYTR